MSDAADGLTTLRMAARETHLAPFVPPVLGRFEVLRVCLLVVRIALTIWAFTLGAIAAQSADDIRELDRAVRLLTVVVIVLGVLWFALGAVWAVLRTRNIHRLEGRYPTRARAARVWVYAPVWIALMSATLVQLEPHPELDVRPPIIVVGFVVTMFSVYHLIQRLFKSLVRSRPDAATFVLYIVDLIGFGLIWWRLVTWPEREVDISSGTVDLLTSASFAAAIALLVGLLAAVYLDLELDRSEDIRVLALRTRHDHRVARLQGLDPLDSATRWALWTARHVADRTAAPAASAAVGDAVPVPAAAAAPPPSTPPPAPATLRPTRSEPTAPLVVGREPDQLVDIATAMAGTLAAADAVAAGQHGRDPDVPPAEPTAAEPTAAEPTAAEPTAAEPTAAEPSPAEAPRREPPRSEPAADGLAAIEARIKEETTGSDRAGSDAPDDPLERIRRRLGAGDQEPGAAPPPEPRPEPPADVADVAGAAGTERHDAATDAAAVGGVRAAPEPDTASSAQTADDALARALRRQLAEAQRQTGRERGGALADWGGDRRSEPPLSGEAADLALGISAELDRGGGPTFADRVRALSEQYIPTPGWPGAGDTGEPTTMLSGQSGRPASTPGALANRPKPPRLLLLEAARFAALLAMLAGAIASGWMLVGVSRYDAPGAVLDIEGLEVARRVVVYAFTASSALALWWAWLAARHASRVEPTIGHMPFAILAGTATVVAGATAGFETGEAGRLGLVAMIVAAGALLVGLRLMLPVVDTFGLRFRTFNAWLFDIVAIVVFLLASPLGAEIEDGVDGGRIAFGVILVGLGLAVGAALASLATEELEGALKGSSELARLNEPTPARSPGTRGSSPPPSGPRRSG